MKNFILRTPIFPISYLKKIYKHENPIEYIYDFFKKNLTFQQAIYISSKVLYHQVHKVLNENKESNKEQLRIGDSLINYYIRMCYRCTPFGLNAGLTIGQYSNQNLFLESNLNSVGISIDGEILNYILRKIEQWDEVQSGITYYRNNTIVYNNDLIRLIERKFSDGSYKFNIVEIEPSYYIDLILNISTNGIKLDELKAILYKEDLNEPQTNEFIHELINAQILISELDIQVTDLNFELTLYNKLNNILLKSKSKRLLSLASTIKQIFLLFEEYKSSIAIDDVSLSFSILKNIDQILAKLSITEWERPTFKIDLLSKDKVRLPLFVLNEIKQQVTDILSFRGINLEFDEIKDFKHRFLEKYENQAIPLMEALDKDIGIGFNNSDKTHSTPYLLRDIRFNNESAVNGQLNLWDEFILNKYFEYLKSNSEVIEISQEDLNLFRTNINFKYSALVDFQILSESNKHLQKGDYIIDYLDIDLNSSSKKISRFAYASDEINDLVKEITLSENDLLGKHQIFAEINHVPHPRTTNILNRPSVHPYEIPIYNIASSRKSTILLSDLYLTVLNNRIVLFSRSLQKEVIPRLTSAQNFKYLSSSVYNFLGCIQQNKAIQIWDWSFLDKLPFLPRVTLKNGLLCKARWKITREEIYKNSADNESRSLELFFIKHNVSRYVTLRLSGDSTFPLDIKSKIAHKIILKELKRNIHIYLEEDILSNSKIFSNKLGYTTHELQAPIFIDHASNKSLLNNPLPSLKEIITDANNDVCRKFFPGNKWLYLKIYIPFDQLDVLFTEKIPKLLDILQYRKLITKFFFIRYVDPEEHLRIRFYNERINITDIVRIIDSILKEEIKKKVISKIQIDTYDREVERYGGKDNMGLSENIFYYDSICVVEILKLINKKNIYDNKWIFALVGVAYYFYDFKIDHREILNILRNMRSFYYNILNKGEKISNVNTFYRKHKAIIENNLSFSFFEKNQSLCFKKRSESINIYIKKLNETRRIELLESYIHMFLNRLFEKKPNHQEVIIYDLLILYFQSLDKRKKNAISYRNS